MASEYRYFIEPCDDGANELIAQFLNDLGMSSYTLEQRAFVTDTGCEVVGAYQVSDHTIVTRLKKSEYRTRFRVYVQEGAGQIRLYNLYHQSRRRLARTAAVKKVAGRLR
ncbi:MAG: hypothetical protein H6780_00195 [Candidatus Nomurabacteria bacterium]|nr:MAG: hypothetical protein H6780_00195 [Candidatus Nomurabacteria bacterium]